MGRRRAPDLRDMGELADRLDDLARVPSRASKAIAGRLTELLDQQFESDSDPYGNPWAALAESTLKRKRGDSRILERSDNMRPTVQATPARGAGVELRAEHPAGVHQTGGAAGGWRMPARKLFPEGGEFPEEWQDAIDEELDAAFASTMSGGKRRA